MSESISTRRLVIHIAAALILSTALATLIFQFALDRVAPRPTSTTWERIGDLPGPAAEPAHP
jgi:hypothetical protein